MCINDRNLGPGFVHKTYPHLSNQLTAHVRPLAVRLRRIREANLEEWKQYLLPNHLEKLQQSPLACFFSRMRPHFQGMEGAERHLTGLATIDLSCAGACGASSRQEVVK